VALNSNSLWAHSSVW